ncbi:MAG: hypothetical protein IT442_18125 [Phycisphaeraceae bacterium]|nr:hypothetical protein [Phycisphaeraceae bacterium]
MAKVQSEDKAVLANLSAPRGPAILNNDFWENDLQMCLDPWLENAADMRYMANWVGNLTKRQLRTLCDQLGLDGEAKLDGQRESLLSCNGQLTPFYLVERFAYRRSKFAIADYASRVLPANVIEDCRSGEENFDTLALLFALFHRDPKHLRTVYHLEKVHTTGFARMKLKGKARKPDGKTFTEFLTHKAVSSLLTAFDEKKDDGRASELMEIVPDDDHPLVFIRRGEQRSMLLRSRQAIHGFRPEWIILDFRDNGRRVDISSHSMSIPLEIANRIISAYYETNLEYENELEVTPKALIDKFLDLLKREAIDLLKLAEVHVKNSPLDGAPVIKLSSEGDESVSDGVRHFEKAVGGLLGDLDCIKAIKVLYGGKRVKIVFEPVTDVPEGYCVRYTDKPLNARERTAFEKKVRDEPYGIRILSTEKRHKQERGRSAASVASN